VALVRVLVAIEPQMYREVLAFHISQQRPQSEVVLASPQTLEPEAERTRPHLIIASEVPPKLKEMGFWVEVSTADGLVADISADGYSTTIHDASLENMVAVVDKAEEELAHAQ
jgi:hypothetical protein